MEYEFTPLIATQVPRSHPSAPPISSVVHVVRPAAVVVDDPIDKSDVIGFAPAYKEDPRGKHHYFF